jgi:hypothetical protein
VWGRCSGGWAVFGCWRLDVVYTGIGRAWERLMSSLFFWVGRQFTLLICWRRLTKDLLAGHNLDGAKSS